MKKETPKFVTPVSMEVTQEQYNEDLKKPLEEMGYVSTYLSHIRERRDCLCTNVDETNNSIEFLNNSFKTGSKRYFIEEYNPELFLALAAMTSEGSWIVGEYMTGKAFNMFRKIVNIEDNEMYYEGGGCYTMDFAKKPTKEEIINHFKSLSQESVLEDAMKEVNEETSFQKEAEKHHSDSFMNYHPMNGILFEAKQREVIYIDKPEAPKPVEITHVQWPLGGWAKTGQDLSQYDRVVYLGSSNSKEAGSEEKEDMFAGYKSGSIIIMKGHLNSGKY